VIRNIHNPASRLWSKDTTLWQGDEVDPRAILDRLGWLDVFGWINKHLAEIDQWVQETVASNRFQRTVVLGMGGSSLAPEVFSKLFAAAPGHPSLTVLDSTSPDMVKSVLEQGVQNTLFVVASKSGTTLETMDLYRFFYGQVGMLSNTASDQFVAITDADSWLEQHALSEKFNKTFINPHDIGGRYSALSLFGIVPAALHGVDVSSIIERAHQFAETTKSDDPDLNPALTLGSDMAIHAMNGQDKLILSLTPALESLGAWIEQLVAESTGKGGQGILPVCESASGPGYRGGDAFKVLISDDQNIKSVGSGHGAEREWYLGDVLDIGAEFFKWEFATAIAASYLGVNPFDEPNVTEAKKSTDRFINHGENLDKYVIADSPYFRVEGIGDSCMDPELPDVPWSVLKPTDGGYLSVLAYLPMEDGCTLALEQMRNLICDRLRAVCTVGFGPRYLHSTGQLHKGGAPVGTFLQLTSDSSIDFAIPGRDYTFNDLFNAQADGDIAVLAARGLPVMRVYLKGDRLHAIQELCDAFSKSLNTLN
jgi:glucose-6-phosphate isomerase